MTGTRNSIVRGNRNVFRDLKFANADSLQAEAILAHLVGAILAKRRLSQREAAAVLGIDQADVSKIVQGRYTGFSLRRLVRLLNRLGQDVELVVKPSRSRGGAQLRVRAA